MRHARTARNSRRAPTVAALLVGLLAAILTSVLGVTAAHATVPATAHDPIGGQLTWHGVHGGVRAIGWATDPDDLTDNATVYAEMDGTLVPARTVTSIANPAVTQKYHTGPTPSFSLTVPVPKGPHTVCIVARNSYHGVSTMLGCVPTPFGTTTLTSTQTAAHSPVGAITRYASNASTARFVGWASDPDYVDLKSLAVLYIDGSPATTVWTVPYSGTRPAKAGANAAFDISVPVSAGTHVGCVWIVNIGLGSNSFLGCDAVDTRGAASTGPLPAQPTVNKAVLTEALTHRGQAYVFGAEGPKVFDCSGLVQYSYAKSTMTVPRVSEAQALAARLIPAARALPGDLVFTHDSEGDVYHVGIYVRPGIAFAAIDPQDGVNYQNIWDPSSTTYGSFTHT